MYPMTDVAVARTGMMGVSVLEMDCRNTTRLVTFISAVRSWSICRRACQT